VYSEASTEVLKETLDLLQKMQKKLALRNEPAPVDLIQRSSRSVGSSPFILLKLDSVPMQVATTKISEYISAEDCFGISHSFVG